MTQYHVKRARSAYTAVAMAMAVGTAFFALSASSVRAATASLFLTPAVKNAEVGATFTETVYVGTDVAVNSAEATVTFPKDLLRVTSVSSSGIFTLWASQPSYSNAAGTVSFSGGLPTPGYKGTSGKIVTITFKALAEGTATVAVTGGQVLANDGQGTNVLKSQRTASVRITKPAPPANTNVNTNVNTNTSPPTTSAPTFSSTTNPDQDAWYRSNVVNASWQGGTGVEGYSVVFDTAPDSVPETKVTTGAASFSKDAVADGVWYLHVRAKYATGWSPAAHYRFQIDATAPLPFTITIVGDPTLSFETTDATSGVDHYELSLDNAEFKTVLSPYTTPILDPGTHNVAVRAYDKAGNMTESSATFDVIGYPQPVLVDLTPVLFGNKPLILRGLSNAQDSIRLTIDGVDYGPYAVSDHLDPNPPSAMPEGMVAWKIEVEPNVAPGEHSITLTAIAQDGTESAVTSPVKFRIVTNAVQLYNFIIPTMVIVNVLVIVIVLLLALLVLYMIKYHHLHRHLKRSTEKPNILKPAQGDVHIHSSSRVLNDNERLENILIDHSNQGSNGPQGPQKRS